MPSSIDKGADHVTRLALAGLGSYLPERVVENDELGALVGMTPSRIKSLFEIDRRHWARAHDRAQAAQGQTLSDLAASAAASALADAGVSARELDTIVAVSIAPEYISPPLDALIRKKIGAGELTGYTLHSACTGVFRATALVESLMRAGRSRVALVVAAETLSPYFQFGPDVPKDLRMSYALYGDGAAAMVLVADEPSLPAVDAITAVTTDDDDAPGIMVRGPLAEPSVAGLGTAAAGSLAYHDFRRVLDKGGPLTRRAADAVLETLGKTLDDADHLLTHQATGHMREIGAKLGLPVDKLRVNIDHVGNTISASILILMDELKRAGRFAPQELLVLHSAESATWSYGGMAVHWR